MSMRPRTILLLMHARCGAGRLVLCSTLALASGAVASAIAHFVDERVASWLSFAVLGTGCLLAGLAWIMPPEVPGDHRRCLRCGHDRHGLPSPAHPCPECGATALAPPSTAELNLAAAPGFVLLLLGVASLLAGLWMLGMVLDGVHDV